MKRHCFVLLFTIFLQLTYAAQIIYRSGERSATESSETTETSEENLRKHDVQKLVYAPKYTHAGSVLDSYFHYSDKNQPSANGQRGGNRGGMFPIGNISNYFCQPEEFQYYVIIGDRNEELVTNKWKRARVGESVGLREVCLKANGLPLTRKCFFNFDKRAAEWERIENRTHVKCMAKTREHIISRELNALHNDILDGRKLRKGVQGRREVTESIFNIFKAPNYRLLPADVHLTSEILRAVTAEAKDAELSPDVVGICSALMTGDSHVLRISADLNATNTFLDTFETYMDDLSEKLVPQARCGHPLGSTLTAIPTIHNNPNNSESTRHHTVESVDLSTIGVQALLTSNISVFFVNPSCANITGIAIYNRYTNVAHTHLYETQGQFLYRFVYMNESTDALMKENGLEVATFLPETLWQYLQYDFQRRGRQAVVVIKVYSSDCLFVEHSSIRTRKPFSKIVSISIPGYTATLPEVLPFILRNDYANSQSPQHENAVGTGCGFWNYDTWVSDGVETNLSTNRQTEPLILCITNHLTQFSFLLGGSYRQNDLGDDVLITPAHLLALDVISIIGCSLSLLGLLGIWLTAALFKEWRSLASNKVLLNMCVALTLQMILFVFVNTDDMSENLVEHRNYANCIALGALMQYSILVLFTWMLIVAFLQFQRYVTVIGVERPRHYILKSAIAAWGFPLIPTLLVVTIDPHTYIPTEYQLENDNGICYPSGHALAFGVVLPVSLIVIANLTIFIYVFYSISNTLNQALHRHEKQLVIKQIRLSVLLFFLLGLSWIFGIFAFMKAGIVFSYLFCLTATLQGFVLFIYFVILDTKTRTAWENLICPSRHKKSTQKTNETQTITMTSSGLESTVNSS